MTEDLLVASDSIDLAVRDYGGAGGGIVLLHGGGHNLASFDTIGPLLAGRHRVVAYDMRGHGLSADLGQVSFKAEVADVGRVATALHLDRPVLVGHSYGGAVAALAAANKPEHYRAVVTIDQALIGTWEEAQAGPPQQQIDAITGWEGSSADVDALVADVHCDLPPAVAAVHAAVVRRQYVEVAPGRYVRTPRAGYLRSFAHPDLALPDEERRLYSPLADIYDRMTCPLLALFAENTASADERVIFEQRLHRRAQTEVVWFDTGHSIHWEQPEAVAATISAFVERYLDQ